MNAPRVRNLRTRAVALLTAVLATLMPVGAAAQMAVDLQLVLAVDISRSMDEDEQRLQRAGYVAALRDPGVLRAIETGPLGRIAVTYVEWAGQGLQNVLIPWTLVDGRRSAEDMAARLAAIPLERRRRTSISDALRFTATLFDGPDFTSKRRVIDISGDGPNNQGVLVVAARDAVLDRGITINGLPIMLKTGYASGFFDVGDLDLYYEECVIGGFGAFIVTVQDPGKFADAIRRKLILEIAGRQPGEWQPEGRPARVIPAQWTDGGGTPITEVDCQIGEKLCDEWMSSME